jgi:hypothetical protein
MQWAVVNVLCIARPMTAGVDTDQENSEAGPPATRPLDLVGCQ